MYKALIALEMAIILLIGYFSFDWMRNSGGHSAVIAGLTGIAMLIAWVIKGQNKKENSDKVASKGTIISHADVSNGGGIEIVNSNNVRVHNVKVDNSKIHVKNSR